jgi:hypothetical protein
MQQAKLKFCIFWSLYFWVANWNTKDFTPNDINHFLTSVCSLISLWMEFDLRLENFSLDALSCRS